MPDTIVIPDSPTIAPAASNISSSRENRQAVPGTGRSPLKIVFVDSRPHGKSGRLRRRPKTITTQNRSALLVVDRGCFGDGDGQVNGSYDIGKESCEDDSDQEYNEKFVRPRKRPRIDKAHKRRRHGRLTMADKDLIQDALAVPPAPDTQKLKSQQGRKAAKVDAVNLITQLVERINWRQAVAVQPGRHDACREMWSELGESDGILKQENAGDTELTRAMDKQLRQYWSEVLVKSVLDMNIR